MIVTRIIKISLNLRFTNSFIAEAIPVLVLFNKYKIKKEMAITIVFIEPNKIRCCLFVLFLRSFCEMIAAWLEPSPGSKENKGETRIVKIVGLINSFFER